MPSAKRNTHTHNKLLMDIVEYIAVFLPYLYVQTLGFNVFWIRYTQKSFDTEWIKWHDIFMTKKKMIFYFNYWAILFDKTKGFHTFVDAT